MTTQQFGVVVVGVGVGSSNGSPETFLEAATAKKFKKM